jgi:hypothetical protein
MMAHAARQLDETTDVLFCDFYAVSSLTGWMDRLRNYVNTGQAAAAWNMIVKWATPPFRIYRDGALKLVEEEAEEARATMPGDGEIRAVEIGGIQHVTIPRSIKVRNVHTLLSWYPFTLNDIFRRIGAQAAREEMDVSQATLKFVEALVGEFDRSRLVPKEYPVDFALWAEAVGTKGGKRVRYTCWPASVGWLSTVHALVAGTVKILNGEVKLRGVITPEECFEPVAFFKDVARSALVKEEPGKLLNESWQTL